jgi:hypothetical protein
MPHITEAPVTDLRAQLVPGARVIRRFWGDDTAAHRYLGSFFTVETAKSDADGWITLTYLGGAERKPNRVTVHYGPHDTIAVVDMQPIAEGSELLTYAHHDDRLTVLGGYMDAHPGTMHRVWDAYRADGSQLAQGVSVEEARSMLKREYRREPQH